MTDGYATGLSGGENTVNKKIYRKLAPLNS